MSSSAPVPVPSPSPVSPMHKSYQEGLKACLKPPTRQEEDDCLDAVRAARLRLAQCQPFFSHIALHLVLRVAQPHHQVPTAAVAPDGTCYLNHGFVRELTSAQVMGLVCHESMHLLLLFFQRLQGRDLRKFNVAHDYVINGDIEEFLSGRDNLTYPIELPPGGLLDLSLSKGRTAEEIYDMLPDAPSSQTGKGSPGGAGQGDQNGFGDADMRPDLSETPEGQAAAAGDTSAQNALKEKWESVLIAAAQEHERAGRGPLPGGVQLMINELLNPKVWWADALSRWLGENGRKEDFTFRRISRRAAGMRAVDIDAVLPGKVRYGVEDVVVLWDTSGSMWGRETEILSEIGGICDDLGLVIRIIICDAAIHADVKDVKSAIDAAPLAKGGGGSDFTPAFNLLQEEGCSAVVLAFTDGCIGVPSYMPPTLKDTVWVLWPRDIDPTGGKWGVVLRVRDDGSSTFESRE